MPNTLGDLTNRENRAFHARFANDFVNNAGSVNATGSLGRLLKVNAGRFVQAAGTTTGNPVQIAGFTGAERRKHRGDDLRSALERLVDGDTDWFTKPTIPSYHTVWFELHEDLLVTLGIERSSEGN